MKFVRFTTPRHAAGTYGLIGQDGAIEVIGGGLLDSPARTGEIIREEDITRYLAPIDPPNIIAIGGNYVAHTAEGNNDQPKEPPIFIKSTTSVIAHGDNIVLPMVAPDLVDYEAELCVIIGRTARNVQAEQAMDYVFGYTCANDVSARDCQWRDGQWARAKSFDTFCPIGPYVETEPDLGNCHVRMKLNGEVMQDQPVSDMIFSVPTLVSYISQCMTLLPGTIIVTGTPGGAGFARKPPVYLRAGDVCEVEIDGIGTLRNTVAAEG